MIGFRFMTRKGGREPSRSLFADVGYVRAYSLGLESVDKNEQEVMQQTIRDQKPNRLVRISDEGGELIEYFDAELTKEKKGGKGQCPQADVR